MRVFVMIWCIAMWCAGVWCCSQISINPGMIIAFDMVYVTRYVMIVCIVRSDMCEKTMWEGVILLSVVKCDKNCGKYMTCVIIIYVRSCENVWWLLLTCVKRLCEKVWYYWHVWRDNVRRCDNYWPVWRENVRRWDTITLFVVKCGERYWRMWKDYVRRCDGGNGKIDWYFDWLQSR